MDLSKLPKLSKTGEAQPSASTDVPPADATPQAPSPIPIGYARAIPPAIGADAWFNTIIGLLCLFLGRMFGSYLIARATGHPFHTGVEWQTGDQAGQEVAYPDLDGHQMLVDAGIFFFGLAVLLEVIVKAMIGLRFRVPRIAPAIVLMLAIITTAVNCVAAFKLMSDGTVPLMSGLSAAFGGYIVFDAWQVLATKPTSIVR